VNFHRPLEILPDVHEVANRGAALFVQNATLAIKKNCRFTVALSGGNTPKEMFRILSQKYRDEVDWSKVFVFWGDERMVPHNDPESNYRTAHEEFLGKVALNPSHIFRVPTENCEAQTVAREYEKMIHKFFGPQEPTPHFDLIFLGMGTDGHTASLFPDSNYVSESKDSKKLVIAPKVEHLKKFRISLTLRVINNAKQVIFLVAGLDKASVLKKIFRDEDKLPASLVQPAHGQLLWLLDREAASLLKP
jgi:6-phosphogluconolactonase